MEASRCLTEQAADIRQNSTQVSEKKTIFYYKKQQFHDNA